MGARKRRTVADPPPSLNPFLILASQKIAANLERCKNQELRPQKFGPTILMVLARAED